MIDSTTLINRCLQLRAEGEHDDHILSFLRNHGCSKVRSMEILTKAFGLSLGQAKEIVHTSQTWGDVRKRDDQFHDYLERTWLDQKDE